MEKKSALDVVFDRRVGMFDAKLSTRAREGEGVLIHTSAFDSSSHSAEHDGNLTDRIEIFLRAFAMNGAHMLFVDDHKVIEVTHADTYVGVIDGKGYLRGNDPPCLFGVLTRSQVTPCQIAKEKT